MREEGKSYRKKERKKENYARRKKSYNKQRKKILREEGKNYNKKERKKERKKEIIISFHTDNYITIEEANGLSLKMERNYLFTDYNES